MIVQGLWKLLKSGCVLGGGFVLHSLKVKKIGMRIFDVLNHGSLALDGRVVQKVSKRHFFQDIKNSFHGVTRKQIWWPEDFKVFAY